MQRTRITRVLSPVRWLRVAAVRQMHMQTVVLLLVVSVQRVR